MFSLHYRTTALFSWSAWYLQTLVIVVIIINNNIIIIVVVFAIIVVESCLCSPILKALQPPQQLNEIRDYLNERRDSSKGKEK